MVKSARPVSGDSGDIVSRKDDHIRLALTQQGADSAPSAFDRVRLRHAALPEVDLDAIDLATDFLGHRLLRPFLISSMTGGPARAEAINRHLAEAASTLGIALGVGSQRVALEAGADSGLARSLRVAAAGVPLFANLGAVQLLAPSGIDDARRVVDMLEADGLIVHLNPLQELMQPGGDRNWAGVGEAIARTAAALPVPVIAKEVGFGISAEVATQLVRYGVAAIDVAGRGGTNFALIEHLRSDASADHAARAAFLDWGLDTPDCVRDIKAARLGVPIIASGGIRHGLDGARALALGATLFAQAGPVLAAAIESTEAVLQHFSALEEAVRWTCLLTASKRARDLAHALL